METIATTIIQSLVQQLYDCLINEGQNLLGFESEFEQVKNKKDAMLCFLTDVQRLERKCEDYLTVKNMSDKLRQLVYDVEDIILELQTRAAYEEVFTGRRYSCPGLAFRRKAGVTLDQIKVRIEDMEKDLKTYLDLIKDIIPNDGERKGTDVGYVLHHVRKLNIIALEKDAEEIIGWITSKHKKPELIAIVGMGGFGKTALAHKIFFDESVKSHFDERIWVSVSQSFSEREILTSMLKQLKVDDSAPIDDEMLQIENSLSNKKYLIVMDDIWHRYKEWWNVISPYLPQGPGNRNIIITTRYKDVAIDMGVAPERIHPTRELDEKESWLLFCEVAFSANKSMMGNPDFENIGKAIVEKCKGYPLAIKGMGGILAQKIHSLHLWNEVLKDFHSNLGNSPSVLASLQSSYDDLPAMHKHCLLCFSVYPKDCKISARQLIYLWVGEGFVKGNGQKTALEVGTQLSTGTCQ